MIEDKMDEDYKLFLDEYVSDVDSDSDNVSDVDIGIGYNNVNHEIDEDYNLVLDTQVYDIDEDYKSFLDTYVSDSVSANHGVDEDYKSFLGAYVTDIDSASDTKGISDIDVGTGYNSANHEIDEDYKSFLDTYVSDIDTANHKVDEDYKSFLDTYLSDIDTSCDYNVGGSNIDVNTGYKSVNTGYKSVNDDEEGEREGAGEEDERLNSKLKLNAKRSKVEDGSNSSDMDVIIIEPYPVCENTLFISSKTDDSSWFEKEMNPRDGRQSSADDHSQFRRRLMEDLQRPYDHQEYKAFLNEVFQPKQTRRHLDTRSGGIKSYHIKGDSKSYLELYPDLSKAIAECKEHHFGSTNAIAERKEQHRVLFLLRGFVFWLKNLCHEGAFKPWLDESCLQTLRKM